MSVFVEIALLPRPFSHCKAIRKLLSVTPSITIAASALVFKVLGGRFLDRWVLEHVRPLVSIRVNPRNPSASEHLVRDRAGSELGGVLDC